MSDKYLAALHRNGKSMETFQGTFTECLYWLREWPVEDIMAVDIGHVVAEFFPEPDAVPPF